MQMKVKGEGTIAATPEEIWNVIFDPAFMSQVIPGCKDIVQPQEDEYKVKMVLGIPAVQGQYSGTLKILEKSPPDTIKGSIEGTGGLGKIKGVWETRFQAGESAESKVIYAVDVEISGPMASMVGGFMEQVADSLVRQGLDSFSKAITGARVDVAAPTSVKTDAGPKQSLIGLIFKSVLEVVIKRIKNLFKRSLS
jgi:carbon monoxide dehydrogenase subunit G